MSNQLHKRFSNQEVKEILERYLLKEIGVKEGKALLKVGKRRFFDLAKRYREDPNHFSIEYQRKKATHQIDPKAEKKILKELEREKKIIEDRSNPVRFYNYSYLKNILENKHEISVSLPTIIDRAKKVGATLRRSKGKAMTEKSSQTM